MSDYPDMYFILDEFQWILLIIIIIRVLLRVVFIVQFSKPGQFFHHHSEENSERLFKLRRVTAGFPKARKRGSFSVKLSRIQKAALAFVKS